MLISVNSNNVIVRTQTCKQPLSYQAEFNKDFNDGAAHGEQGNFQPEGFMREVTYHPGLGKNGGKGYCRKDTYDKRLQGEHCQ